MNEVLCPLVDEKIDIADCIENSDTADGVIKPDHMPERFIKKEDWRNICKNCKYHNN